MDKIIGELKLSDKVNVQFVTAWLVLAISSLAMSGVYSLPPVILRGSFFKEMFDIEHIFATALVVHVDLSVLVWFLSIGGVFWSFLADSGKEKLYKVSFYLAALGMIIITISPFLGETNPLKNNYVPVLQNFSFFMGLSFFACGIIFQICLTLLNYKKIKGDVLKHGIYYSAVISLIAFICFCVSYNKLIPPPATDPHDFYEELFWGGGHILQFTYTSLMLVAWLWIANILGYKNIFGKKILLSLLFLNLLITIPSPLFYLFEHHTALFSDHMIYFAGISAFFIGLAVFTALFLKKENREDGVNSHLLSATLILSILLFGYGGFLGYMISGVNVTIPAHYHGSIVAVTLAFMGVVYYLIPKLGFKKIERKIATAQPYIYGLGQVVHITGLAWMGGYGALRKSAGSSQDIDVLAPKLLFFTGGSLAILGGLLFIVITLKAISGKKCNN